ncbi:MAG: bifunctional transaldolase/phosoglucose isomerase [Actinomycetota bacterium]|nr:bifunctional transaldolase/phosoglucose isomerase [Actinomycetota bacterium]
MGNTASASPPPGVAAPKIHLPPGIAAEMTSVTDAWRRADTVARMWAHDAGVWTGQDEGRRLGWLTVAREQREHPQRFAAFVEEIRAGGFADAVVLGMGGSSLCPEVLARTYPRAAGLPRLRVLDSTDPSQVQAMAQRVDLAHTVFFVSSKSGTTLEPDIFADYFYAQVAAVVGEPEAARRFVAITDPGSPLEKRATEAGWRAVFHGVASIGGRYSALSDFGMIPGAAAGVDVIGLLDRAETMAQACAASVALADNPGFRLGALIGVCATGGRDKVTILTSPGIAGFGAWLEQLLAESTGKQGRGVIPVDGEPLGDPSVYGSDRLFVRLCLSTEPDPATDATVEALVTVGHPVYEVELGDVYDLGGAFFGFEFAVAVAGAIIGIDPFDQPDVEDAKVAARRLTDAYEAAGSLPELRPLGEGHGITLYADDRNTAELRELTQGDTDGTRSPLDDYLRAHLGRVRAGDYVALLAYIPMTPHHERLLTEMRVLVRDALAVATCVGFGPRFQHSTGQAYKGGPNTGVFLQITCQGRVDLDIPGHSYTFGVVEESQARSDLDVLATRDRRALRLHLGPDVAHGLSMLRDALSRVLGS